MPKKRQPGKHNLLNAFNASGAPRGGDFRAPIPKGALDWAGSGAPQRVLEEAADRVMRDAGVTSSLIPPHQEEAVMGGWASKVREAMDATAARISVERDAPGAWRGDVDRAPSAADYDAALVAAPDERTERSLIAEAKRVHTALGRYLQDNRASYAALKAQQAILLALKERLPRPPADLVPRQYSTAVDSLRDALRSWDTRESYRLAQQEVAAEGAISTDPQHFIDLYRSMLQVGEPTYVAPSVCAVLASAAQSWPLDAPIPIHFVPARYLWVSLARLIDLGEWHDGCTEHVHARLSGFSLYWIDKTDAYPDALSVVFYGHTEQRALPYPFAYQRIDQGSSLDSLWKQPREYSDQAGDTLVITATQVLGALLAFCGQRLVAQSRGPLSRETRRRLEREGVESSPVRVIALRKRQHVTSGEHREVEWSCQWWVGANDGGHWRTIDRGLPTERRVWIAAYIKGDPDKPLKPPSGRLFAVVR